MSNCGASQNKIQEIEIDFGNVSAGTIAKKSFKILNEGYKKQHYQIHRDVKTNPLDDVFKFKFQNWTLLAGGSIDCEIEYRPVIPFHFDVDYFSINDCNCACFKILVQGNCIGPNVVSSVSRLLMICPKRTQKVKKRLQLTNSSDVAATFMFDIEQTNSPFELNVTRGTISPNSQINVTITFSPLRKGLSVFYLPCLIHYQGPIVIELCGYQGSDFKTAEDFVPVTFPDPKPLIGGFEGYMSDAVTIAMGSYPPISISNNFLDFGRVEFKGNKTLPGVPTKIYLTNHSFTDFDVQWDKDPEHIFHIEPNQLKIRGQQSGLFEVYFIPNKPNVLFSKEILAQVFWNSEITTPCSKSTPVLIPLIASVRMIGQSFAPESIGWIPQYEVPRTVVLPPCLPPLPVYATFIIKAYGHLAMTFRFIPPPDSQFTVKPMVGMIQREFQIVALQLYPRAAAELEYIEQWKIQFNGNSNNEVPIKFQAYAEYPKIVFNDCDTVIFAPVYPKCEQVSQVTMWNNTRHCISYSLLDLPSVIKLEKTSGIIQANQIVTQNWIFSPEETGHYKYEIICSVTALKAGCPVGTDIDILIDVAGTAEHGYLVALPDNLNFGSLNFGETKRLSFHAFNFSGVEIHYQLGCKHRSWPVGDAARDIQLQPETGTISPGNNKKIDVCITPHESGFYQLMIQYSLRPNSLSKSALDTAEPRDICILDCMCILSGFEVKDLLYFTHSEHISKTLLWNLLEIDNFNMVTASILPGDETAVHLRFPELIVCQDPLLIRLLIVNSAPVQTTWTLSRVKKCNCQQIVKSQGLSFKRKEYICDHRRACTISPNKGVLQPREEGILTINVCYTLLGKTSLQWRLKLSNKRNVIINADVTALSDMEIRPSLLAKQVFAFSEIYIGDMDAANQLFWMYNSMNHEVCYSLDVNSLYRINNENCSETFSCENACGVIPKRSYYPIIFKFQPRRFECFKFDLPLKLGDTWTNLAIEAETGISKETRFYPGKVPISDQFSIPELPVYFSVDHIVVPVMSVHSKVNRMITIVNESKNEVMGYRWKSYHLPRIIEIKVIPESGRIQPAKGQSFCVTIRSLSQTCKITANVSCRFLNLSAQRTYEKSIGMYDALCQELADQFIITETGITEPKPWLVTAEKPKPFFKTLSISCYIHSLTDIDLKTTVEEQVKSSPPAEIRIRKDEICSTKDNKLMNIATFILEGMIWDILNSKIFLNTLRGSLVNIPTVKYGQYVIPSRKRRKLNDRSFNTPRRQVLESILEQMIFGIVHEEFELSLYHFNDPKDIRQFCYQKRDERTTQQNKLYKSISKSPSQYLIAEEEGKVKSRQLRLESQVKFNVEDEVSFGASFN